MISLKGLGSKKVLKERSQHGTVVQAFPALQQGGGIEHPRLKVWFEIFFLHVQQVSSPKCSGNPKWKFCPLSCFGGEDSLLKPCMSPYLRYLL